MEKFPVAILLCLLCSPGYSRYVYEFEDLPPLMQAAGNGDLDEVKRLISDGANYDDTALGLNAWVYSALFMAFGRGQYEVANFLVKRGANVNQKYRRGNTILMMAVVKQNLDFAKLLIKHGADVNARSMDIIDTALMRAVYKENIDMVALLIEKGARVTTQSRVTGNAALNMVVDPLYCTPSPSLLAGDKCTDIAALLIKHGADINKRDDNLYTPLMNAVRNGNEKLATLLINKGADVTHKHINGETALVFAVEKWGEDHPVVTLLKNRETNM